DRHPGQHRHRARDQRGPPDRGRQRRALRGGAPGRAEADLRRRHPVRLRLREPGAQAVRQAHGAVPGDLPPGARRGAAVRPPRGGLPLRAPGPGRVPARRRPPRPGPRRQRLLRQRAPPRGAGAGPDAGGRAHRDRRGLRGAVEPGGGIVGRGVARLDGPDKVLGRAVYGVDVDLPGMLVGKILRSPLPHARIRGIDVSRARRVPGVRAVLTGADTPGIPYGFFKHQDPRFADKRPLETEKVRFVGDEVAAVAAADEDAALEALALIDVDYEELPPVFDVEAALAPGAPLVHDTVPGNVPAVVRRGAGDLARGWREAEVVVERRYSTHAVAPC